MEIEAFRQSPTGRLVRSPQGYWAFVPHALPPRLALESMAGPLAEASMALGQLAGIGEMLPNPYLLIGPFLRREAVSSSRIEGTRASLSDLFFFEAGETVSPSAPDVPQVRNYVRALEYALVRLDTLPVSLRLVREVHAILLENVLEGHATPGEFRRSQNWIGPPGCTLREATYVPPPVDEMRSALDAWEKFLHGSSDIPLLVQLALIHYQFEAIHPFLDGNGRVGRLLIPILLSERKALPRPLLYLSTFFERHREAYYRLLLEVSCQGAWEEWITFFLRGVRVQAWDATRKVRRLLALQTNYRDRLQKARSSALLIRIVDRLFEAPAVTVPHLAKDLQITFRSAQENVNKLVSAGILEETTGRARNRVYLSREILDTIEEEHSDEV